MDIVASRSFPRVDRLRRWLMIVSLFVGCARSPRKSQPMMPSHWGARRLSPSRNRSNHCSRYRAWTGLRTSLHGFAGGSSSSISSPLGANLVGRKWQASDNCSPDSTVGRSRARGVGGRRAGAGRVPYSRLAIATIPRAIVCLSETWLLERLFPARKPLSDPSAPRYLDENLAPFQTA
jgi:hypothetical protein